MVRCLQSLIVSDFRGTCFNHRVNLIVRPRPEPSSNDRPRSASAPSLQRDLLLELFATGTICLFHRLSCWLHDFCPPEVLCFLLRRYLLQSPRQTIAEFLRHWLLQTKHLHPTSRRRARRSPVQALIFSTKCLFIQQKTASHAPPARSDRRLKGRRLLCQPISAPGIAISDQIGRRFRPLLALVASRPSNSPHPPRKSRGNRLEPRVRHEKVLPCVEIFNAWRRTGQAGTGTEVDGLNADLLVGGPEGHVLAQIRLAIAAESRFGENWRGSNLGAKTLDFLSIAIS
jgi:hypothetical protein